MRVQRRRNLFSSVIFYGSLLIILLFSVSAIFAPYLAPNDPIEMNLSMKFQAPSWDYPLGTDQFGRCILSRLMHGATISLGMAILVMSITTLISILLGLLAGYSGGWMDTLIMRACDLLLAFPSFVLALALIAILGFSLWAIFLVLMSMFVAKYVRMVRGLVLRIKNEDYVIAAKGLGTSPTWIVLRHLVPNIFSELLVFIALDIGTVIIYISGLSFLGLGVQPPYSEWGAMIHESKPYLLSYPSLLIYPSMAIILIVIACNVLSEALGDFLDPKRNGIRKGRRTWKSRLFTYKM